MNTRIRRHFPSLACAVLAGLLAPAAGLAGPRFTLASVVPDDVYMCVLGQHNPERKFYDDYCAEVFEAVKQSGVTTDLMDLVGLIGGQEQQAEAQKLKDLGTELFHAVDWGKMAGKETAFAMRMPRLVRSDHGFNAGPPGMVCLFSGEDGSGARNFEGLVGIAQTILAKVNEAAGAELKLEMTEQAGAQVATVTLTPPSQGRAGDVLSIARRGDLVVVALGEKMLADVLGLVGGSGSVKALSASPRFTEAFATLPAAEDTMFFFDVQRLMGDIRAMTDEVFKAKGIEAGEGKGKVQDNPINTGNNPEAKQLSKAAFEAYQRGEHEQALALAKQACEKDPTDSIVMYNLACFHALRGEKEEALDWLAKSVDGGLNSPNQVSEDADLKSLRQEPRYKAALAKTARQAGGDPAAYGVYDDNKGAMAKRIADRVFDLAGMWDYIAEVEYTDGFTTRAETVCVLTAGASKQPFYGVFGKRRPQTDFAKYLPKETVSFSVAGGIDYLEMYDFLEETARMIGPQGESALQRWAEMQQQAGFDLRKDVLSWLQGDRVSVTMRLSSGDAWVAMLKVTDEAAARQKVEAGLNFLSTAVQQMAAGNPMLAMLTVRTTPVTNERLPGFVNVFFGASPSPMVCGVTDGHIILAANEQAAALCLATAAGEHPNVTANQQVMSEALVPSGPFDSVSFTDKRQLGENIAQVLGGVSMAGGMASMFVPNPKAQMVVVKLVTMLGKLAPAARKIDFLKSSASQTTFDGKFWRTREVTNYASPAERSPGASAHPTG